jgi:hypothetical protein
VTEVSLASHMYAGASLPFPPAPPYPCVHCHPHPRRACRGSPLWLLLLLLCTAAVLIPAELLEGRYFVLPFLLYALHSPVFMEACRSSRPPLQLVLNCAVNAVTLYRPFCRYSCDFLRFCLPEGDCQLVWTQHGLRALCSHTTGVTMVDGGDAGISSSFAPSHGPTARLHASCGERGNTLMYLDPVNIVVYARACGAYHELGLTYTIHLIIEPTAGRCARGLSKAGPACHNQRLAKSH